MDTVKQSRRLGVIGSLVGLVALLVSALTHLLPGTYLAVLVGQATWNEVLSMTAASLGVLAITLAVVAVIMKEERLLAGIAAVLGTAAIAVQIWWVLLILAIAIIVFNSF
ncbi:hypothetical protein LJR220_004504 [Bradyrhizobium sp. LjRoot220]|uniref:hypothetical protein n=1 Tax=Bradyrhizobium sp. LjRoot220 TaxID=3342284 RepID=UPI003ECFB19A